MNYKAKHFGKGMKVLQFFLFGLTAQIAVSAPALAQSTQASASQPPLMDRQKESALALSACPASVASKAAVYVLEKSGYVKIRDGQNGLHGHRAALAACCSRATVHGCGGHAHVPSSVPEGGRAARSGKEPRRDQALRSRRVR